MFVLAILTFTIGLWTIADGIIVERNYHTYFKVQILLNSQDDSKKYYHILQCPPVNRVAIPKKPEDIPICTIVGNYTDRNERSQMHQPSIAGRSRSKLRTKVDYTHLKKPRKSPPQRESVTCRVCNNPEELNLFENHQNPKNLRKSHKRRNIQGNDQLLASTSSSSSSAQHQYKNNDDEEDIENNTKNVEEIPEVGNAAKDQEYNDDDDYNENGSEADINSTEAEENDTPLKYIGVHDIIKKFSGNIDKIRPNSYSNGDDDFSAESESFFSNQETFANGDKWKGYQNAYHRDEFYNDHIFYDDEEDSGDYHVHRKTHENF